MQQPEPFAAKRSFDIAKSGDIAARPRDTFGKAGANWVGTVHEHNRDCMGLPMQRRRRRSGRGNEHVGTKAHELLRK